MNLIEVITACVLLALGTVIGISFISPLVKINSETRKLELQLSQDKFICETIKKFCNERKEIPFYTAVDDLQKKMILTMGLDSFNVKEYPDCFAATWSKNGKTTTFYIAKEKK